MSLAVMGSGLFVLGLLALAGGLFLAQRLRVQHRRVPVVTSLFWDEAREDSRARVFLRRFRHPWAYALILGIAGLTWLALAGPRGDDPRADRYVLVLDRSAAMMQRGGYEATRDALFADLEVIPAEHREVVIDDGAPRRLLAPGEHPRLVREREADLDFPAGQSRLGRILDDLAREARAAGDRRTQVLLYGHEELDAERRAALPDNLVCAVRYRAEAERTPLGVASLGVAPARSGAWDRVDLMVSTRNATVAPSVTLDGAACDLLKGEDEGLYFVRDLPARGGRIEASIEGGESAGLLLPERKKTRVAVADESQAPTWGNLPPNPEETLGLLAAIVDLHPGLARAESSEEYDVGISDSLLADWSSPGLNLAVPQKGVTLALQGPGADDIAQELKSLLAEHAGGNSGPLLVTAAPSDGLRIATLDPAILNGPRALVETAALPLLVGRCLEWLSGAGEFTRHARAGDVLDRAPAGVWTDAEGRAHPSADLAFRPLRAGTYVHDSGETVVVAPAVADPLPTERSAVQSENLPGSGFDWIAALVLIVLALLVLEWVLVQSGRMP